MSKPPFHIIRATKRHLKAWADLRPKLWPKESSFQLRREPVRMLGRRRETALLAQVDNQIVGFIELRLRDVAEGATTSPVGYIEGWYVLPKYRQRGIGAALVEAGEAWAKGRGVKEMGSDTWLDHKESQRIHQRLGYTEVERLVAFHKRLQ